MRQRLVGAVASVSLLIAASAIDARAIQPDSQEGGDAAQAAFDLNALIAALDDERLEVRRSAQETLASRVSFADLELALATRELTPEQRRRLESAAFELFITDLAGLGVSFGFSDRAGTTIENTVDPHVFPAASILRAGDVLVSVEGVSIDSQARARIEILSRRPGEVMETVVRRDGELLTLALPLGHYRNLRGGAPTELDYLRGIFAYRRARLNVPGPGVVGESLDARAWIDAAYGESLRTERDTAEARARSRVVGVAVGGTGMRTQSRNAWDGTAMWAIPRPRLSGVGAVDQAPADMRAARASQLRRDLNRLLVINNNEKRQLERADIEQDLIGVLESRIAAREELIERLTIEADELSGMQTAE